ncbi:T9SS type A sorting domain-containing protein [Kaistella palustris]|uniref:T9SS type A sorting domain-containing protein n=1 Tax=Kaistella palustris TaxID=493376 RepID=UPI000409E57A|nr:T9SS type A sorting domain-containing protein [Kaistella palustris]
MKSKFTLLILVLCVCSVFGQSKNYDLLAKSSETKILYDRVYPVSDATNLKNEGVSATKFLQIYHEMQRADFLDRLPKVDFIQKKANLGFSKDYIPLSLLTADFENINSDALKLNKVALNSDDQFEVKDASGAVFDKHQINILAPILGKATNNEVKFLLENDLVFNTTDRHISAVEIKSENGWQKINVGVPFVLKFSSNGVKTIPYKLYFTDGRVLDQSFSLNVKYQKRAAENHNDSAFRPNVVTTISSTIPYQGYGENASFTGKGEYEVFLDSVDGVLDKPIILVDGFDPGDTRNTTDIYNLLNYGTNQNLGDVLRAQGYDIIVLNFPKYTRPDGITIIDGGVDYIQRNAMILAELLNVINAQKAGAAKNVVIGPSMGGLITRYALRYMELNGMSHDARLYLSFDAPHLGANVPVGFQHLFNYMGFGPLGDLTMQEIVNGMLKSPAAKEMLLDHFEAHLQNGSATEFDTSLLLPVGAPGFRAAFQNELNTMGFPQNTRNVAIANGAGNGTTTGTPGMTVLDHTFNTSGTQRAIIKLNFTPAKNQTLEVSHFKGQQWILFWITFYESMASSKSPATSDGLDSAPGGRFDIAKFAAFAEGNALLTEFLNNLNILNFDFIPTLSSLAVSNTADYYAPVTTSSVTPFAAYSVPSVNEDHVTLDAQNVQFALNEILNTTTLATNENSLNQITIENPVRNLLKIKSPSSFQNAAIMVTDVTGRTVFRKTQDISGLTEIPVSLRPGIYMVTISGTKGKTVKKVTVNN